MAPAIDPSQHATRQAGRIRGIESSGNPRATGTDAGRRSLRRRITRGATRPPTTVWPCAADHRDPCLGGWLERAVVKIVGTYTEPGQRVLLITPPTPRVGPPPRWTTTARHWPPCAYGTLCETNWTVTRLGRSVQTTLSAHPEDQPADHRSPRPPGRASAHTGLTPRLRVAPDRREHTDLGPTATRTGQASRRAPGHVERFDLILTAAHPRDHSWLTTRDWSRLLRPHGTLAVITHGERQGGQLVDPLAPVIATVSNSGLRLLDHVILLVSPPTEPADLIATRPGRAAWKPTRHERGHHDLLTFAGLDEAVRCGDG